MRRPGAPRIDYTPGPAAAQGIAKAEKLRPDLSQQALIDFFFLVGLSAWTHPRWTPPALHGTNREKWRADVPSGRAGSGTLGGGSQAQAADVPELDAGGNAFLNIALNALTKDPP